MSTLEEIERMYAEMGLDDEELRARLLAFSQAPTVTAPLIVPTDVNYKINPFPVKETHGQLERSPKPRQHFRQHP